MVETLIQKSPLQEESDPEIRKFEKVTTKIHDNSDSASLYVANEIAALIRERQAEGKMVVLGLATGS
ncbi:MAG: glucosamine-6-phosphate deaminase, partial [Bacteroidota bacterium]